MISYVDESDYGPDAPQYDLRFCKNPEEDICDSLYVTFYGKDVMDIRVIEVINHKEAKSHNVIRVNRNDIEWLFRLIGRNIYGWSWGIENSPELDQG